MSTNPYQSPTTEPVLVAQSLERLGALRNVRIALLIMLVPGIYNFITFSARMFNFVPPLSMHLSFLVVDAFWAVVAVVAIWFFGLNVFEFVAGGCCAAFANYSKLEEWKHVLYLSLHRLPLFAFFGAVVWTLWVFGFYHLGADFFAISVLAGLAGHLLGAGIYLPLFYRWYRMERAAGLRTAANSSE